MVGMNAQMLATVYPGGVFPDPTQFGVFGGFACCYGPTGILTVGATPLNTPAWDIPNLARLWAEAGVRGSNQKLPTVPGNRGYPTRLDQSSFTLKIFITGDVDATGAPSTTPWEGLEANLATLYAGVFDPVTTGRGTRTGILTMPDGTLRTADVQVDPLKISGDVNDPSFVEAEFTLTVVSGRFV